MGFFDIFRSQSAIKSEQLECMKLDKEMALMEHIDILTNFVDPREALRSPDGQGLWLPLGFGERQKDGSDPILYRTEQELREIRRINRLLSFRNEFAINALENRISYVVGTGYIYNVAPKKDTNTSQAIVQKVQGRIDAFIEHNEWGEAEQENQKRGDRDGEYFLRYFRDPNLPTTIRWMEPEFITADKFKVSSSNSFGIVTDPDDVLTVIGYQTRDGEMVPADEVQHERYNVDRNMKRGLPIFHAVEKNFDRAEKLLRNMSIVMAIQAAIALIRRHEGKLKSAVQKLISDSKDFTVTEQGTGKSFDFQRYGNPRIIDVPAGQQYEMPTAGINAANGVAVLQAELRAIASRLILPEFMFTSDASNANMASTLVAQSPAHKNFERWQATQIRRNLKTINRALEDDVFFGRLSESDLEQVDIQVEGPVIEVIDRKQETERHQILFSNKAISRKTWQMREGFDPDQEEQNNDEEKAKLDIEPPPLPLPGDQRLNGIMNQGDGDGTDDNGAIRPEVEEAIRECLDMMVGEQRQRITERLEQRIVIEQPPHPVFPEPVSSPAPIVINNQIPAQPTPDVKVEVPIEVQPASAPEVTVPIENKIEVQPGETVINQGDTNVEIDLEMKGGKRKHTITRNPDGSIKEVESEPDGGDE